MDTIEYITQKVFVRRFPDWTTQAVFYQATKAKRPKIRFEKKHGVTFVKLINGDPYIKTV